MSAITTDPGTIGIGQIEFRDSIEPPLLAGNYTLKAEQEIKNVTTDNGDPGYIGEQPLLVDGPRFSINPAIIHSLFPPANQLGTYDNTLPNIVFTNFSLPWSRKIGPSGSTPNDGVPWMGLLTVYADDLLPANGSAPKVGKPAVMTVEKLLTPASKVLLPDLQNITNVAEQLTAVEMDLGYFQSIAPGINELPYLAHARQVNTGGKVMLGMDDDGCFSVVIGNRLPAADTKNTILLVSYEGHQNHLNGVVIPGDYKTIRLVLLGSWEFTGTAATGSFKSLMDDLCKTGRGGVDLLQIPKSPVTDSNALAKEALEISYIPLQNQMRDGESSTSWYRGPLVAAPTKRDFTYGPYLYSDHAMQYDPEYGLFNHAYSSAWQIGRLLALSDGSFANGLFNWRNGYLKTAVTAAKNQQLKLKANVLGVAGKGQPELDILSGTLSLFADKVSKVDWPTFKTRAQAVRGSALPGKLSDAEIDAMRKNNNDPLLELVKKINEI